MKQHLTNASCWPFDWMAEHLRRFSAHPLVAGRAENHLRDINMKSTTKKLVVFSSLVVTGLAAPVAFSSAHGVSANNACADPIQTGTCCPQNLSICNAGGGDHQDYY